jgi:hypothetical protein
MDESEKLMTLKSYCSICSSLQLMMAQMMTTCPFPVCPE